MRPPYLAASVRCSPPNCDLGVLASFVGCRESRLKSNGPDPQVAYKSVGLQLTMEGSGSFLMAFGGGCQKNHP